MSRKPPFEGELAERATQVRLIDGHPHVLMMWLVIEKRADGTPVTMRLLQDHLSFGEEFVAAGLCTPEEIASGEAQARIHPEVHVMWTPQQFKSAVTDPEVPPEIAAALAASKTEEPS